MSQTYEEALEAQKKNKESKKPAKAKNPDNNKKKNKWKKNNKGENTDKNDAVSVNLVWIRFIDSTKSTHTPHLSLNLQKNPTLISLFKVNSFWVQNLVCPIIYLHCVRV